MKKKKSKKKQTNSNLKDQKLGQTKNSAKLVLFVFGIGPITVSYTHLTLPTTPYV